MRVQRDQFRLMPDFGTQLLVALCSIALFLTTYNIVYVWVEGAR